MRTSIILKILAVYLGVQGAFALLAPQAATGVLGHALSPFDIFTARTLGAILMSFGFMDWALSRLKQVPAGVFWPNLFLNVSLGVIDTLAILAGTIGAGNWVGIGIHLVLCGLVILALCRKTSPA